MNQLKENTGQFYNGNKGFMLIGLIAAITIIGIMSAGTLYFTSGSTQTGLFSNAYSRAYYLAESGIRYARLNEIKSVAFPVNTQFNLDNGDAFIIKTMDDPSDSSRIIIYSTGIVNSGSWFESKCNLSSNSPKSGGTSYGSTDVSFTVTTIDPKGKLKTVLDPRWNVTGGSKTGEIAKAKASKGAGVIELTNQTEGKDKKGKKDKKDKKDKKGSKGGIFKAILLSLGWWDVSPENPDLEQVWEDSSELLSYEAQVKIKLEGKGGQPDHFMQGISFRLRPQETEWTDDDIESYGISYFKSEDSSWPFNVNLDSSFNVIMSDSDPYIVLWEETDDDSNTLSLLDYKKLDSSDGVLDGSELEDWATIFVKVEEKFTGAGGKRENHISGFIQGPDSIPLGTIDWDYNNYNIVSWNTNDPQPVLDDSLTSKDFDDEQPDEIGVHAFYESSKENKQYFSDFSLRVIEGSDSDPSYQW